MTTLEPQDSGTATTSALPVRKPTGYSRADAGGGSGSPTDATAQIPRFSGTVGSAALPVNRPLPDPRTQVEPVFTDRQPTRTAEAISDEVDDEAAGLGWRLHGRDPNASAIGRETDRSLLFALLILGASVAVAIAYFVLTCHFESI